MCLAKRFGTFMDSEFNRKPVLGELYQQYLADQDTAAFIHRITQRYTVATLCRLVAIGDRLVRRSSVLAIGFVADYECNAVLGRALSDPDRGVRLMAERRFDRSGAESAQHPSDSSWPDWQCSIGRTNMRSLLRCDTPIREAPWLAEVWNQ